MKKIYTKYDYIYIYSKLGVITTTFAVVSISLSLFLGFIVTLAGHAHPDLSSRICFVLFVLNLPFVFQKVKRYQAIQNKLKKRHPGGTEDDLTSHYPSKQKTVIGRYYSTCFPCFYNTVFMCPDALAYDFIL